MSAAFHTGPDHGLHMGAPAAPGAGVRVLVAEDDPVQALLLTLFLDRMGIVCVHVCDGLHAVEAVKRDQFAMVLMDFVMPRLNGVDATRAIRCWEETAGRPRLPIIAVTASAMREECESYVQAGMDEVLLKPFSAEELRRLVYRFLPLAQLLRALRNG
jgi:CheY-like chemotaxis protein